MRVCKNWPTRASTMPRGCQKRPMRRSVTKGPSRSTSVHVPARWRDAGSVRRARVSQQAAAGCATCHAHRLVKHLLQLDPRVKQDLLHVLFSQVQLRARGADGAARRRGARRHIALRPRRVLRRTRQRRSALGPLRAQLRSCAARSAPRTRRRGAERERASGSVQRGGHGGAATRLKGAHATRTQAASQLGGGARVSELYRQTSRATG